MSSRVIQHWKSKGGKFEIIVRYEQPAIGVSYYVAELFTSGQSTGFYSRQTRVSIDCRIAEEIAVALKVDDTKYILQKEPTNENTTRTLPVVSREELSDYSGL